MLTEAGNIGRLVCRKADLEMAKSDRTLRVLMLLRQLPQPVTAARLASELEVSKRTIYRDIETLRTSGALIDGSPRYGFTMTEDPAMPPMVFTRTEIEAVILALGAAEVFVPMDEELRAALLDARAKIVSSMPGHVQRLAQHAVGMSYSHLPRPAASEHLKPLREAAWDEREVRIGYSDRGGSASERSIWPLSLVVTDGGITCLAWCCLRQGFRNFRLDAMTSLEMTPKSFRPRRAALLREHIGLMEARDQGQ